MRHSRQGLYRPKAASLYRIGILLSLVLGLAACQAYDYQGFIYEPAQPIESFELTDHEGQPFVLAEEPGWKLFYFGYTFCPDHCPATMLKFRQIHRELGDQADDVQLLFATVDPGRDTQEQMTAYVNSFEGVRGLRTEDISALDAMLAQFGAYYVIEPAEGSAADYLVGHNTRLFLVDPQMNLRANYAIELTAEDIAADLRAFVKE